jgi:outer membrane protein OmpA-like peptidoglycan-associated protein
MYPIGKSAFKDVEAWQIQILDSDGRKVSFIQGLGAPHSPVIPWSGLSAAGEPLPDGFYDAQLIWSDATGPHKTAARKISLLTPPSLRALFGLQLKIDYTSEGLVVRVPEIMVFDAGQSQVRPEALPALRTIAEFLKSSPDNKVDVRGYTDASGSRDGNMALSEERALAVMRFLAGHDIDPRRLTYRGLGAQQPISSNATPEGRAKNRRVEVVVLKSET